MRIRQVVVKHLQASRRALPRGVRGRQVADAILDCLLWRYTAGVRFEGQPEGTAEEVVSDLWAGELLGDRPRPHKLPCEQAMRLLASASPMFHRVRPNLYRILLEFGDLGGVVEELRQLGTVEAVRERINSM